MIIADYVIDFQQAEISNGNQTVLQDVDIQLMQAEFCYLVGKTGSGKSSLLKTMYAENKLVSGKAKVLDYDLSQIKRAQIPGLRRQMGMVFQSFQLFKEWTVGRNLAYVLSVTGWRDKDKMSERIQSVLASVGLESKMKTLCYELSGGEQQRVAIARAILNEPKIIIADEPTGNLDPDTSDQVLEVLRETALANSATVLIATHDQRIIEKFPSRILQFEQGRVRSID